MTNPVTNSDQGGCSSQARSKPVSIVAQVPLLEPSPGPIKGLQEGQLMNWHSRGLSVLPHTLGNSGEEHSPTSVKEEAPPDLINPPLAQAPPPQ